MNKILIIGFLIVLGITDLAYSEYEITSIEPDPINLVESSNQQFLYVNVKNTGVTESITVTVEGCQYAQVFPSVGITKTIKNDGKPQAFELNLVCIGTGSGTCTAKAYNEWGNTVTKEFDVICEESCKKVNPNPTSNLMLDTEKCMWYCPDFDCEGSSYRDEDKCTCIIGEKDDENTDDPVTNSNGTLVLLAIVLLLVAIISVVYTLFIKQKK